MANNTDSPFGAVRKAVGGATKIAKGVLDDTSKRMRATGEAKKRKASLQEEEQNIMLEIGRIAHGQDPGAWRKTLGKKK